MDELVKILLCEGGDVELCARTSKQISVFAFDPLSLTLSYFVPCIDSYCSFILICLVVFVCVLYLCLTKRASYSTSTLTQRNQEELVQSPSPGIRLHSLVTLSVLQLVFKFRIICHRLALHLSPPPLGILSIGIRSYAPDIRFNHLGERSWLLIYSCICTHIVCTHGFHDPSYV